VALLRERSITIYIGLTFLREKLSFLVMIITQNFNVFDRSFTQMDGNIFRKMSISVHINNNFLQKTNFYNKMHDRVLETIIEDLVLLRVEPHK
jgi:hypothetical protein